MSWSGRAGTASAFARFARRFLTQTLVLVLAVSTLSAISVSTAPSANASYTTGSADFGGSDRYLTVANGGDFAVGTGDFTVEWWQRMTSAPSSNQTMVAQSSWPRVFALDGTFQLSFEGDATNPTVYFWLGSGGATALGTLTNFSTDHQNQWKHLAVTRTSSTLRFYIGGVLINSFSNMSGNVTNSADPLYIGRQNIDIRTQFPGQITNFHFIKGTSKYGSLSALTGLTAPFVPTDNTKLLLKFESSSSLTTDSSSASKSVTNNGAVGWSNLSPTWTSNQPQTISFTNPGNKTLGSGTFLVSPTSSSGLTVTVTSATTSVCTVSGTTVTLIDIGTCTLSANQSGNASFAAATQVQQSFTVSHPVCSSPTSTSSGGYTYVAFKNLGTCTWTPLAGVSKIDLLVVAGGGGGGSRHAGGGGAGGVRISTNLDVNGGPLTIVVGDGGNGGGARSDNLGNQGANGSNSSVSGGGVSTLTAIGGGGGTYDSSGGNGGSGGGGGCCGQPPGNGTDGQGNPGSAGFVTAPYYLAGGGGGAGTAGVAATGASQTTLNPVAYRAGLGGTGAEVAWIPTSVRSTLGVGVEFDSKIFFAGGGGGGTGSSGTGGTGGTGGGGAGATTTGNPAAGTSNTGGGGGGAGLQSNNTTVAGGKGGSGVVVIRYLNAPVISVASSPVTAVVGTAVTSYLISNSGGAAASYAISPALAVSGLTFSTSTGLISGTPTAAATSATYTITATNASGTSSATFSITSFPSSCSPANTLVNGFTVLQFQNVGSCSWNVPTGVTTIDILVVGGGGAGGALVGGGGGAGGYLYSTSVSVTPGAVNTITVGAGGVNSATAAGGNGGNSSFNQSLVAIGGGGGGTAAGNTDVTRVGSNGGSGGGASSTSVNGGASPLAGTGTAGQGNSGGISFVLGTSRYNGGGGGGSNGEGAAATETAGGKGGAGTPNSISGASVCYATGGGGAYYSGAGTSGAAGDCAGTANPNGGRGGITTTSAPTAVTANTGGGGGGGAQAGATWTTRGANGGSGVVIVRYEMTTSTILTPAFGTPTATAIGYTVQITNYSASYTWAGTATASGSVAISNTGLVTVTGVAAGTSSTATITTARTGYTGGSSTVTGTSFSTAAPGAPTIGTATLGNGSATVTFTAPTPNGGSTITSYTATSSPGGFTGTLSGAGSGTITVSGLTNGTAYTFTVTATNANGTSSASAASNSVIPRTVPGAPTSFAATAGNNQVALTWAAPSSNGGSAITGYTVTSSPSVTAPASCTNTVNLSCTFTGLTNGTAYTFGIRAINAAGNSTSAQVTATPGKAAQTITFNSLNNRTLGTGTYSISASSNSSLTVALTSATTDVCTISSGTITLVSAGTCTINANQTGDDNYLAATQVQRSFTVATALTITTPSGSSLEGNHNSAYSLTISASGGAGSNSFAVTGSLPTGVTLSGGVISGTPSTAGNYSLTVTVTDANSATATTSSFTIAIAKGTSTVSLTIPSFTYTGSPQGPDSVTKTGSTGSVTYAYAGRDGTSYASSSTKPTAVGTYTVTATVAADDNYASVSTSGDFVILQAVVPPTIGTQPMAAARTIGQSVTFTVAATASDSGTLSYQWQKGGVDISGATSASYTLTPASTSDAGDFRVIVTNTKNSTTATSTSNVAKLVVAGTNNHRNFARNNAAEVFSPGNSFNSSSAVIPSSGSFTYEGWFKEGSTVTNQNPIFFQGSLNSQGFGLLIQTSTVRKLSFYNGGFGITATPEIVLNKWYHYAITYDSSSSTIKLFLNGTEIGSQTSATPSLTGTFTMGKNNYYSDHFFHGQQDQVKVWTSALTATEIIASMHSYGEGGIIGKTLRTLYDFNQSSGSTLTDVLGGFDLSANGSGASSTWVSSSLAISFDEQGGSPTATDTTFDFYTRIADPGSPTRSGYTFSGWSRTSNGSVISFPYIFTPLEAITLYSIWSANSNTVAFDTQGGTSVTSQSWSTGTALTLPETPTRLGYRFNGWFDAATGGNQLVKNSLIFDGVNDRVTIPHSTAFNFSTNLTIEAWINTTATRVQNITTKGDDSFYLVMNASGQIGLWLNGVTSSWTYTNTTVNDGNWHHIAATYNGSAIKVYIDGVERLSLSFSATIQSGTSSVEIGSRTNSSGVAYTYNFTGKIYDVRYWNVARTASEISSSMNSQLTGTETGLVSAYLMNQGAPGSTNTDVTSVINAVSGASNGTLSGFSLSGSTSNWVLRNASYSPANTSGFTIYAQWTALSTDATLSALTLSSGTLSPTFVSGTTSYTASVANSVSTGYTLTPTVTQANATTVQYLGSTGTTSFTGALSVGTNVIRVVVTAQDGTTTATYTVTVTRAGSNDATLSGLAISSGTLSPTFTSGTTSYTASVTNATTSITVTPTRNQANATITVNGTGVTSASASGSISLNVGSNTITVIGTAQDGTTTATYTVTVTRAGSSVATLSGLSLSTGTLSPVFASGTTTYTASVAYAVSSITVTPTVTQADATITVNGTAVNSGSASGSISLNVGSNTITVVVTAQDGVSTRTYTVTVTRSPQVFTITYAAGTGGSGTAPTSPTTVNDGATFTTPANTFVRTGYTFAGWQSDTSTVGANLTFPASGTVSGNVTLTATWNPIACTIATTSASGYTVQRVTANGSCVWSTPTGVTAIEVAVIGGGGGGGFGYNGGGGGAGEVLVSGTATLSSTTVTGTSTISATPGAETVVTIGAGGTSGAPTGSTEANATTAWSTSSGTSNFGGDGTPTSFGTISAAGGGGGGGNNRISGGAGGSGGGAASGGTAGAAGSSSATSGWTSFRNAGSIGGAGSGGGAGSVGTNARGGSGVTVFGVRVAGGGGGWGKVGSENSLTDAVLGGNGRLASGTWGYAGSVGAYTSNGVAGTGTGGGGGALGGSGSVIIRYAAVVDYTYDANGGTGTAPVGGSVQGGTAFTTAANPFTRTGYTFAGWYTTANGTGGTAYTENASNTMQISATAIVLYAKWTIISYTITYSAGTGGSGTGPSTPTAVNYGATFTAPANTFTRNGYTFAGWSDGTNLYQAAATYPSTGNVTANVALTATWETSICSPTSTTTGGYTIYTFTTAGTCLWTVPNGLTDVQVLAVAGGGGGGYSYDNSGAGGGAGGQVKTGTATLSTTLEVTVGAGGSGGIATSQRGGSGANSVVSTITALGGTGGCASRSSCADSAQATSMAAANGGLGGLGGASGRGGGGSNTSASATTTTAGGAGTTSNYSGSSAIYGIGGSGGTARAALTNIAGSAATANTGNGGGGASAKNASGDVNGGAGGSGLVIIRVASALTITFDSQSGSSVSNGSTVTGGSISTAPTEPTRSNYTFLGWFTSSTGGTAITFPYTHGQSANFTLYAQWSLSTYSIVFNANNGTGTMANQSVTHGVAANLSANLYTRANYVFHRWATNADGTGTTYNNLVQLTLTAGTTLYAQWTPNTYVVTYNYNNATGGNSTTTSSFTTGGSVITLPTPTRTGFTFGGWFSDAALASSIGSAGANYSPTGTTLSLTAHAKWNPIDYTFTYDSNSADSGTVPTETSKQINQTATVKANTGSLIRVGYTFGGWNTQSNGEGTNYLSGSFFTVGSSNVILYAKWSANTYTITYNSNGGSGSAQRSSNNVLSDNYTTGGSSIRLPAVGTLEKSGYNFGGWNTSAAGTGTNYSTGDNYTSVSNVTLYAKWNPITYSITYNGNTSDGGNAPTTGSYTTGQSSPYSVLTNTFTKTSNVFGGWNTAAAGTGTSYSPGANITTVADIVLYAVWIPQFTLHYAINGGTVNAGSTLPADTLLNANTSVTVFSALSRTGYTFDGWTNGSSTIAPGGNFNIAQDSVLTAKWTPINYTIAYNSDGGTEAPSAVTKQIGQSYTVGGAISKPGYNFNGWSNGSSNVGAEAVVTAGASNVTYTAQWTPKVFRVSYDWNGGRGTAVSDVNYTFGTSAITLPTVGDRVKDGYTFAGWSESLNGSALNATYIPSQNRTLYALWNIGNFTVTYDPGRGTLANTSVPVQNGSSTVLPLPTRANFVFNGWHTAVTGGSSVGSNGASFTPAASQTVYARWIQSSLYGINDSLSRIGSITTTDNIGNTFSGANSNSSVAVSVPANALPAGTTINFDLVGNSSRATGILPNVNYLVSIALSWLTGDETVPDTASGKAISITITNASIKAGAAAYAIVNNVSTLLGTATQDGSITVSITSDPEIVVAATKPDAPINVAATSNGNQQSVITWNAPGSNGGSAITGYTVTANTGATCTTSTTSCTISGLANGTAYTFTVTATNVVGPSVASTSASATTAALYAVAFDAKSGTTVTSGSFLTASTVSEPTAPTRTGYTFAGWAATDGGSAVTFPYAPGVTSNITMYARWDALDNVVRFDSKSGSAVADGTFPSGGNVTEPTAPTRSGYTFGGWSATDGGAVVTFPYAPGVVTDITLYAKWNVVTQNNSGGNGGGNSGNANSGNSNAGGNSNSSSQASSTAPGRGNVTTVAPVTVVGDASTKVPTIEISAPATGSDAKPPVVKIDKASEKFIAEVKVVDGKLTLTPETGFSGKKIVTVTVTENGADRFIQIPLTVLPEPVSKPVLTPTASNKTIIRWTQSPNADAYSVYLNGKKICSTEATSCSINRVLGPDADIQIVSNGGDRTVSAKAEADFRQNTPVPITRLVSATITKGSLSRVDTKALDKIVALIKTQGFGTVVISEISTTSKTKALADARIAAIKKYIDEKTGSEKITFEVVPPTTRTYFNNIAVKG